MTAGLADEPGLDVAETVAHAVAGDYPGPGIVYAVLVGIHADGEVEHTQLPGFVADAILAAERARHDAAGSGLVGGSGQPRPRIVCLCGSTRFMDAFHAAGWERTLAGEIVLSVGVAKHVQTPDGGHAAEAFGPGVAEALDELHKRKIDLADYVLVVSDESGYFGGSTLSEIRYARDHGKEVRFAVPAAEARWLAIAEGVTA